MSTAAAGAASTQALPFWRQAGLSYVRYLNIASKVLRAGVKEKVRTDKKMAERDAVRMAFRPWAAGKRGNPPVLEEDPVHI